MDTKNLIARAERHRGTLIGEPQPVDLSRHCPVSAYLCPVSLPTGCAAPAGQIPVRIGAGASLSAEWARTLALFEAIERFSLQYRTGDPETAAATRLGGSVKGDIPAHRLLLGHPVSPSNGGIVDSRGCSIGRNPVDAAARGLLELIERDAFETWRGGTAGAAQRVVVSGSSRFDEITEWLDGLGRELNLLQMVHPSGAQIVISICCDISGAKPALGSAAGFDAGQTLTRACLESIVSWRNLMAIDLNGLIDEDLPPAHAAILRTYRGQNPIPDCTAGQAAPVPVPFETENAELSEADQRNMLDALLRSTDEPVMIFDMTREDVGIPVVRVLKQPG